MAQKLKKKYIENDAVDGSKLKLLEEQAVRAVNSQGVEVDLIKLSGDDKVLLNGEVAVVQPDLDAEKLIRANADADLQSQINNIISNVDPAAIDSLTEILAAFQQGDTDINTNLAALSAGSSSAINQEVLDRQLADAELQSQLSAEVARAEAAEASLQSNIDTEASIREAADTTLQSNLDTAVTSLEAQIAAAGVPLTVSEVDAEGNVLNATAHVSAIRFDNSTGFSTENLGNGEVKIRLNSSFKTLKVDGQPDLVARGEDVLQIMAGDGISITTSPDSDPKMLTISMSAGMIINALQEAIDAEASARQAAITAEEVARIAADADLQFQLDIEKAKVAALESVTWIKIKLSIDEAMMLNHYVDLSHLAVDGSLSVSVDRLTLHEGELEDFTVSTVNGVTRVTFVGDLLTAGDNLYIKYQYRA